MPSLQDLIDKAHSALNATPIGPHLPNLPGTTHAQGNDHTSNEPSGRSYAFESMSHQLRTLQQQYGGNATPLQKLITAQKGVAIDFEGLSRDTKAQSKELYMFGQSEAADLKDVTDRLAYLNFVHGSLASSLSNKLDASRTALKSVRDAESALMPKRNIRAGIVLQMNRIKSEGQKGADRRLAELQDQLKKAENEDQDLERQFEISKRKFIRESEEEKWAAIREYGEKLILLSQASTSFLSVLPSVPPSSDSPYKGANMTGATRAALQHALDIWTPGQASINLLSKEDTIKSETRSFGETHASELSTIGSPTSTASVPASGSLNSPPAPVPLQPSEQHPMDPSVLNNTPAPIPSQDGQSGKFTSDSELVVPQSNPSQPVSTVTPTVAETGRPIAAGDAGPGPKTGSLSRSSLGTGSTASGAAPNYQTAEEEKRRLEREERDRVLALGSQLPPSSYHPPGGIAQSHQPYESAEEEKKRLEREERDRILRAGGSSNVTNADNTNSESPTTNLGVPPPYHD